MNSELKEILERFAACGWELIEAPSRAYLAGLSGRDELIVAVKKADAECGGCGCEFDPLYKRALELI